MAQTKKEVKTEKAKAPKLAVAKVAKGKEVEAKAVAKQAKGKAPAAKTEGDAAPRQRAAAANFAGKTIFLNMDNQKVASSENHNPKRGKCREWFDWYMPEATKKGLPVEEYLKRGGKNSYIKWDSEHELITLK